MIFISDEINDKSVKYTLGLEPHIHYKGSKEKKIKNKRLKTDHTYPKGLINCKEAEGNWKAELSVF